MVTIEDPSVAVVDNLLAVIHRLNRPPDSAHLGEHVVELGAELITGAAVDLSMLMANGTRQVLASCRAADFHQIPTPLQRPEMVPGRTPLSSHRITDGAAADIIDHTDSKLGNPAAGPRFDFVFGAGGRHQKRLCFQFADESCITSTAWPLAAAYAAYADVATDRNSLLEEVDHLREAVRTNREIGAAIGVLMVRHMATYDEAFQLLRRSSQHSNRKLRDVATRVVYTGDVPAIVRDDRAG